MRLERALDSKYTHEIERIARALDVVRLVPPRAAGKHAPATPTRAVVVNGANALGGRRALVQAIALFLVWPRQPALFVVPGGKYLLADEATTFACSKLYADISTSF